VTRTRRSTSVRGQDHHLRPLRADHPHVSRRSWRRGRDALLRFLSSARSATWVGFPADMLGYGWERPLVRELRRGDSGHHFCVAAATFIEVVKAKRSSAARPPGRRRIGGRRRGPGADDPRRQKRRMGDGGQVFGHRPDVFLGVIQWMESNRRRFTGGNNCAGLLFRRLK